MFGLNIFIPTSNISSYFCFVACVFLLSISFFNLSLKYTSKLFVNLDVPSILAPCLIYVLKNVFSCIPNDKGPLSLGIQLKTFFNTYIRQGTPITGTKALANNFEVYFRDRLNKEIASKKTQAAKQKYEEILEVGMKILRPNRDGLYFAIATYITFQSAKSVLLNKLNTIQSIGSFLRTKRGYKVTSPEGYVAIQKGGAVKLVDRLEFSRANFNMAKDWVKG